MKCRILNLEGAEAGTIKLPPQFDEAVRADLIKRAVICLQANRRQQYGADPMAGKKTSVRISKKRRDYRGCYGIGMSRVPRKVMSRRGTRFNWVGAFAPGTVGGRKAHPPKSSKKFEQKINKKERKKALRSGMAGTMKPKIVEKRGHKIPANYPFVVTNDFEKLDKTKKVINVLEKFGLKDELKRASKKNIRAGKGTMRGRKYIRRKGPLLIVSSHCKLIKTGKNIPGINVVKVNSLNIEILAPGGVAGRLALFTKAAVETIDKEKLFM